MYGKDIKPQSDSAEPRAKHPTRDRQRYMEREPPVRSRKRYECVDKNRCGADKNHHPAELHKNEDSRAPSPSQGAEIVLVYPKNIG